MPIFDAAERDLRRTETRLDVWGDSLPSESFQDISGFDRCFEQI